MKYFKAFITLLVLLFFVSVTDYFVFKLLSSGWIGLIFVSVVCLLIGLIIVQHKEIKKFKHLGRHEDNFTTFINTMVDFVIYKDGKGRWLEANEVCLKLFEIANVNYRGKKDCELADYTTPFYRDILLHCEISNEKAWSNGKISRYDEIFPQPDGTNKYFDTIKVPIFNDDGSRRALVVIGRDITDKKFSEERLRKTEKLSIVGELAASVGHEIRNPLTSIKGFLQLLRRDDHSNTFYYDLMLKELDRINQIVSELLILAKPQKLDFSREDAKKLLDDVVSLIEAQANMNNVNIHFPSKGEYWIECEPNKLKQLFINIIKNAVEASKESSTVLINIEDIDTEKIKIIIQDEGPGIPKHFQTRLGEPFYSSKEKGTGLGLTVSHKIVEQHQGEIKFNSQEEIGTTVEVYLPKKNTSQVKIS